MSAKYSSYSARAEWHLAGVPGEARHLLEVLVDRGALRIEISGWRSKRPATTPTAHITVATTKKYVCHPRRGNGGRAGLSCRSVYVGLRTQPVVLGVVNATPRPANRTARNRKDRVGGVDRVFSDSRNRSPGAWSAEAMRWARRRGSASQRQRPGIGDPSGKGSAPPTGSCLFHSRIHRHPSLASANSRINHGRYSCQHPYDSSATRTMAASRQMSAGLYGVGTDRCVLPLPAAGPTEGSLRAVTAQAGLNPVRLRAVHESRGLFIAAYDLALSEIAQSIGTALNVEAVEAADDVAAIVAAICTFAKRCPTRRVWWWWTL